MISEIGSLHNTSISPSINTQSSVIEVKTSPEIKPFPLQPLGNYFSSDLSSFTGGADDINRGMNSIKNVKKRNVSKMASSAPTTPSVGNMVPELSTSDCQKITFSPIKQNETQFLVSNDDNQRIWPSEKRTSIPRSGSVSNISTIKRPTPRVNRAVSTHCVASLAVDTPHRTQHSSSSRPITSRAKELFTSIKGLFRSDSKFIYLYKFRFFLHCSIKFLDH